MPTSIRRVVTGIDGDGKGVFVSDGPAPVVQGVITEIWKTDTVPGPMDFDGEPQGHVLNPPLTGTKFTFVELPPQAEQLAARGIDPSAVPDDFGMHETESIDYVVIISGEVWLKEERGEVLLKAGDSVVQRGTRHAWHNRSDKPCMFAAVLVGANRTWSNP